MRVPFPVMINEATRHVALWLNPLSEDYDIREFAKKVQKGDTSTPVRLKQTIVEVAKSDGASEFLLDSLLELLAQVDWNEVHDYVTKLWESHAARYPRC